MKTLKILLLLGVILAGATYSCKKQNVNNQQTAAARQEQLVSQVSMLTDKYIEQARQRPVLKTTAGGILRKDGEAALLGAIGGAIGGAISGGPAGALAGGLSAGISGGVVASLKAWWFPSAQATIPLNPPTTNPDNAYDEAGAWHYTMMAELMQQPSVALYPNGTVNYTSYRNYALDRLQEPYPAETGMASSVVTTGLIRSIVDGARYDNLVTFANSLTPEQVTQTEKQILISYFTAYENMSDGASFSNYSVEVENAVTASNLSEVQKQKLLITMATFRHGVAFYGL